MVYPMPGFHSPNSRVPAENSWFMVATMTRLVDSPQSSGDNMDTSFKPLPPPPPHTPLYPPTPYATLCLLLGCARMYLVNTVRKNRSNHPQVLYKQKFDD